jgi:Uma2 family endonuclease
MSVEEYLEREQRSPIRHEYVYGYAHAMSGASTRHNRISRNLAFALRRVERGSTCRVYLVEVKVRAAAEVIYYPDVVVACGAAADVEYVVDEPAFVAEVASPSTRATDRREKLVAYQSIPSLRGYLLIDHRVRRGEMHERAATGEWVRRDHVDGDIIHLDWLGTTISIAEIYDGVVLPPLSVGEEVEEDELV